MNLNEVDWESLEDVWGFLFEEGVFAKIYRKSTKESSLSVVTRTPFTPLSEELVILVYAYEKFERLIRK